MEVGTQLDKKKENEIYIYIVKARKDMTRESLPLRKYAPMTKPVPIPCVGVKRGEETREEGRIWIVELGS